jgi:branched-chain amino acid transport system permease protein
MSNSRFTAVVAALVVALWLAGRAVSNEYVFFVGYSIAQYVLLASAWNLLGGYAGYINFGSAAFLALGAYLTVAINKLVDLPLPLLIVAAGLAAGTMGLAMGYLTLKLRGVFFSIATLALAIVFQTVVTNWQFVGGASGAYVLRPTEGPWGGGYVEYLFYLMVVMAAGSVALSRLIERSSVGLGLASIRDDEGAAEASGVPTLRLKLLATTLSGMLMGMAGAPLPFYVAYLDPPSAFNLSYAVNTIAMPLVGGAGTWIGPVIGAVLLTTVQQAAMVTISSASNLLLVGVLMVAFIALAPNGIVGLVRSSPVWRSWLTERKSAKGERA